MNPIVCFPDRLRSVSRTCVLLLALPLLNAPRLAAAPIHLKISVDALAMDAFGNWTATGSWENIKNFRNANASRPVVDLVLELRALKAGGLDFDFELMREITYDLAKQDVIDGRADLTAETVWDDEIDASAAAVSHTDPVIRKGECVFGLYSLPTNQRVQGLKSEQDLHDVTAAVVGTWATDVKTLQRLPLNGIRKVVAPELVYMAIRRGNADFMLDQFSMFDDLHIERSGLRLIPAPGFKVAVDNGRSWIISRRSADAETLQKALSAGLKLLRENGTLTRAYTESGYFNPKVANWKPL